MKKRFLAFALAMTMAFCGLSTTKVRADEEQQTEITSENPENSNDSENLNDSENSNVSENSNDSENLNDAENTASKTDAEELKEDIRPVESPVKNNEAPVVEEPKAPGNIYEPYRKVLIGELYSNGRLSISDKLKADLIEESLSVKGSGADIGAARIVLDDTFKFDGNPVNRISVNALVEGDVTGYVDVYIDDEDIPIVSIPADGADESRRVSGRELTGEHKVSLGFTLDDALDTEDYSIVVKTVEFAESSVPVLYINIDESLGTVKDMNESPDHSARCYGSIDIEVPEEYVSEYTGSTVSDYSNLKLEYIRGRGNSTWYLDKKPYKFKLGKSTDLFGMGKNKHWVLLADRYDNTHLKNRLTYWLGAEIGMDYTPQIIPVEVVMNGKYYGTYSLCEQVRIGKSRVDIDELTDEDYDDPIITGGYLIAMSPYPDDPDESKFMTNQGFEFLNDSPDFVEEGNESQKEYIRDYVSKTENAIYGKDFKDENGKSYKEYMDIESAAKYWWIQEFTMNRDAYRTSSTFLYKPRNGKLYWGPLWDFDAVAWGNLRYTSMDVAGFGIGYPSWLDRMKTDPEFIEELKAEWPAIDAKLEEMTKSGGILDQYYEEQKIADIYNLEVWGYTFDNLGDYSKEIEFLRKWIDQRRQWINENLDQLDHLVCHVSFYIDDELYSERDVNSGASIANVPKEKTKTGYVFDGWYMEDGSKFDVYRDCVVSDMKLFAKYVKKENVKTAEEIFLRDKKLKIDLDKTTFKKFAYVVYPEEYEYGNITWTSSDESVAVVGLPGYIYFIAPGKVTVTASLSTGNSSSCEIEVVSGSDTSLDPEKIYYSEEVVVGVGKHKLAVPDTEPEFSDATYNYWIDDDSIATVNFYGVVTGIKPGETHLHAKCRNTGEETDCKVIVTDGSEAKAPEYKFIKGAGASWKPGSEEGLEAVVQLEGDNASTFSHFKGVEVDRKAVAANNYLAEEGSVKLTLKPEYLETLSSGLHELALIFDDGKAESTFNVLSGETEEKTEEKTEVTTEKQTEASTEITDGKTEGKAVVTDGKKSDRSANTGDESYILIITILMLMSFAAAVKIYIVKKRR